MDARKNNWKKRTAYSLSCQGDQYRVTGCKVPSRGVVFTAWLRDGDSWLALKYFNDADTAKARTDAMRYCSGR